MSTTTISTPWPALPGWLLRALGAALACVAAGCATHVPHDGHAHAAADGVPPGIVSVTYADPSRFSDGRSAPRESAQARQAWLDALSLHLADQAAPRLPEGQRLEVHITDVQRAGGFEPWRGPQAGDVRIVRDLYPPRIDLNFKVLAADGRVVREGRRQLRDAAFLMKPDIGSNDTLRYEKALIDDWVRQEFTRKG